MVEKPGIQAPSLPAPPPCFAKTYRYVTAITEALIEVADICTVNKPFQIKN